jgi:type IV secretory pathway TrbF-like protein
MTPQLDTVGDLKPQPSAKRQFIEQVGTRAILSAWAKGAIGLLTLVVIALVWALNTAVGFAANNRPMIVRVDTVGRAEAITYDEASVYKPQAPELRYFLTRFVTLHYGRLRGTIARDYSDSLFFLAGPLGDSLMAAGGRTAVDDFVANPSANEVDIEVRQVTLTDLSIPPYQASVDFVATEYAAANRTTRKQQTFTAQVAFTLRESVPNAYVRVNPLGLQITQLQVYEAFD